jgi:hypothetical protein
VLLLLDRTCFAEISDPSQRRQRGHDEVLALALVVSMLDDDPI